MDTDFRACGVCTSSCFKEHGLDGSQQTPPNYTRPPCFLLPSLEAATNWTAIPREFADSHGETLRGMTRILGSNGREWSVEIGGPGKLLGFKGGWKSFVSSTTVKRGDQMLFCLISNRCFALHVFNKLGVEVIPPPPVETKVAYTPASGKRKRGGVKSEPVSDGESDDGSDSEDDDDDDSDSDMSEYEAPRSDAESDADAADEPTVEDEELVSKPRKKIKRKFTGSVAKEVVAVKGSHKKKAKGTVGMYIEPGSCTTTYESRRREVTRGELDRAMTAARAMKTEFPSIPVVMMPSHVYRGFWLTIPGKFSKEFMPQERREVTLLDKHNEPWPATWIRSDKHTGLSGGWAAFSKDHALEEGDVCVFEVIDPNAWKIRVHIFRVVQLELKAGARFGWEKTYNIVHGALMHQPGVAKKFKNRTSSPATKKKKKSTRTAVKKTTPVRSSRKKVSEESSSEDSDEEDEEDSGAEEDDDVPLTSLFKDKAGSDCTSEEIDVKPRIISMGPIPKISKVKEEHARLAKVKQEPGDCPVFSVKQEYGGDVKPSLEELRASLSQRSALTTASIVKPEPVETDARKWYRVVRLMGKKELNFKVDLGPDAVCNSGSCKEAGDGFWFVPHSQFSLDMGSCYMD